MTQIRVLVASFLILAAMTVLGTPTPAEARKGEGLKFWAVEFRVVQSSPEPGEEGEYVLPKITLRIEGRAGTGSGNDKSDFEYDVPDARPWLDVLMMCSGASGRLLGIVDPDNVTTDNNKMTGRGDLRELTCRQVLK